MHSYSGIQLLTQGAILMQEHKADAMSATYQCIGQVKGSALRTTGTQGSEHEGPMQLIHALTSSLRSLSKSSHMRVPNSIPRPMENDL